MSGHSQRVVVAAGDILSGAAVFGTLVGALPPMVAIAGLIWYALQIWESDTVQGWIHGPVKAARRRRAKYRARSVLHFERNQAMVRAAEAKLIGRKVDPVDAKERQEAAQIIAAIIEGEPDEPGPVRSTHPRRSAD